MIDQQGTYHHPGLRRATSGNSRVPECPWISTDLQTIHPNATWRLAPDCEINGRCYRKLDPEYFAWLRSRMLEVKAAHKAGRVAQVAFDELRTRFNELQETAIALFGEKALQNALRALRAAEYRPPAPDAPPGRCGAKQEPFPEQAARPDGARSRAAAEAAVNAIRDQALEVGWTRESLHGSSAFTKSRLRCDLVTAMCRPGTRIGQVTCQWIAIIGPPPHENILRLYNPDVEQPWVKHVGPRPDGAAEKNIRPPVDSLPAHRVFTISGRNTGRRKPGPKKV